MSFPSEFLSFPPIFSIFLRKNSELVIKEAANIEHFKKFINAIKTGNYESDNLVIDKYWIRKLYNLIKQRDQNTDITKEWINDQIIKQNYLCYHSGLKLVITEISRYPFKPSIFAQRVTNASVASFIF